MSIAYESAGRTHQKQRTRQALIDAARELVARGITPKVDEAAANAAYLKQMLARKDNPRTAARGKPPVVALDPSD